MSLSKKKNETGDLITVKQLLADDALYRKLLTLWSDKDYRNHSHNQPPPDSNFFNTFGYFGAVSEEYMDVGLNILKQRALKENVEVFTDLLAGYLAAEKSSLIVGVNIVAPENNVIALADYTLHMRMYNYLPGKYPGVNRALHAGELTLGMVRPKNLTFHIKQARDIAQAQRIGHGVDLPYEQHSLELLKDLKDNAVVEINLTSNEFILGVEKNEHPYLIYSSYGVPLVIATDDSGVSRNNLTNEYMLLATRYQPAYGRIKEYVYNSIKYSFLQPADKVSITNLLDKRFVIFESEMANLYKNLSH